MVYLEMRLSYYSTIYYKMLYCMYYKNVYVNILNNVSQFMLNVNISIEYIKHYEFLCGRLISKNIYQNKAKSR